MLLKFTFIYMFFVLTNQAMAIDAPKVGRDAAAKYFQKNPEEKNKNSRYIASESASTVGGSERLLTFGVSAFTNSESYNWGASGSEKDVGKLGLDMSYRLSTSNYVDYSLRVLYTEYKPQGQRTNKMSFMYAATLPDAGSNFPLYFGAAAGPGVFFNQIKDESSLTLDYQLYLGLRLFNLFDRTGFYIEGGMKNHIQLTSDGQLNGTFGSAGAVFTF